MAYKYYRGNPSYVELDGTLSEITVPYLNKLPDYATISIADTLFLYAKLGIPKHKLMVELPFYGRMNYITGVSKSKSEGFYEKGD